MNSAEISSLQKLAVMCYRQLLDPGAELPLEAAELAILRDVLGPDMRPEDLSNFGKRLKVSAKFKQGHAEVAARWKRHFDAGQFPSEQQALAFISDFFDLIDHSIFFDQGVTASSTHKIRGEASASELDFPGGMPCWTLHLTVRGRALFLGEATELEVSRGHLMLFHPEAHYHYGLAPGAHEWEHLWVLFQPRAHWSEWLDWDSVDQGMFHMVLPGETSTAELESLFHDLIQLRNRDLPYRSELEHTRLEEILIRARGLQSRDRGRQAIDRRIARACEYIEAQVDGRFSVDDVARACNLSSSRLAHLFKQQMGVGPMAWSNNLRLQRARKLLLDGDDPVAAVAARVGYEDPTQFARNFRRNVGCSPREFRKSFRRQGGG